MGEVQVAPMNKDAIPLEPIGTLEVMRTVMAPRLRVNITKNSKAYGWEITLEAQDLTADEMLARIAAIDAKLRVQYGEQG